MCLRLGEKLLLQLVDLRGTLPPARPVPNHPGRWLVNLNIHPLLLWLLLCLQPLLLTAVVLLLLQLRL